MKPITTTSATTGRGDAGRRTTRDRSGAKWARELAAFKLLFDWAVVTGVVERSSVATHTVRRRDGTVVEVADNRPMDVRAPTSDG
jgi:hypothetical protein